MTLFALALSGTGLGAQPAAPSGQSIVYNCAVPAGFQKEYDKRNAALINGDDRDGGWYAKLPAALSASYSTPFPVSLDLSDTPVLIGALWGGPGYGDQIFRRLICGHSLETHQWTVLIQAVDAGFASFDVRDAISDQPLPTAEEAHAIVPHSFRFQIAGTLYQYVVTGVTVDLVKVWRPDLVEMRKRLGDALPASEPHNGDPDSVWPTLGSVTGLLFASGIPREGLARRAISVGGARDAAALGPALLGGRMVIFAADHHEQPTDIVATPVYLGRVMGVGRARFSEPEFIDGLALSLDGEKLIVMRQGGSSTEVDLGPWFDHQSGETSGTDAVISAPAVDFELDGVSYRLVVNMMMTSTSPGADGRLVFESDRIMGDLFASKAPTP